MICIVYGKPPRSFLTTQKLIDLIVWPVVRGDTNHHTLHLSLGAMQCFAVLADMQACRLDHHPKVDTHHASTSVFNAEEYQAYLDLMSE